MANTLVGLYRSENEVSEVLDDLTSHDFARGSITVREQANENLRRWLVEQGVPRSEADEYVDGVIQGGRLVTLEASEDRTPEALEIMRRHELGAAAGTAGGRTATTGAATKEATETGRRRSAEGEQVVDVTEEELEVGTRQVERGGIRVRTYVTERPVEEDVRLRDETIHVERHKVDRPAGDAEVAGAFQDRSVEMTETDEEAVVSKRAHVIEEIVLSKDVEERTETVRDTVRRTDAEVEEFGPGGEGVTYDFDADRDHFREHHRDNFASTDYAYDDFQPAYRYGAALASHPDYHGRDWSEISPSARERWEERNRGTWTEFEPAVRYGYERSRGRTRR